MRTEITPGQNLAYIGQDLVMTDNLPLPPALSISGAMTLRKFGKTQSAATRCL